MTEVFGSQKRSMSRLPMMLALSRWKALSSGGCSFSRRCGRRLGVSESPEGALYETWYSAVVGLNIAISRHLSAGTSYLYHRYQFDNETLLPNGAGRQMDRQGVRAYLTVWAPLFYRARTPDVTR